MLQKLVGVDVGSFELLKRQLFRRIALVKSFFKFFPKQVTPQESTHGFRSVPWISVTVILVVLITCLLIYLYLLVPREIFHWDEASYADRALKHYNDLKGFDFKTFIKHLSSPEMMTIGFLHIWIEALFFLLFGVSYISARSLSLFFFFLSLILIYRISLKLHREKGWLIGILAILLMVLSPEMLNFSTLNMQEPICLFMILLAMNFYFVACERQRPLYYYATGIAVGLAVISKHSYGLLLCITFFIIGIYELSANLFRAHSIKLKVWVTRYLLLFFGFLIIMGLWLLPVNIEKQISHLKWEFSYSGMDIDQARGSNARVSLITRLSSYPYFLRINYTFSLWLGVYLLLSIAISFLFVKDVKIRAILIYIVISWFLLSKLNVRQPRYIYTVVPFVFLLAAFFPIYIHDFLKKLRKWKFCFFILLLIYLFLISKDLRVYPKIVKNSALCGLYSVMKYPHDNKKIYNLKDILDFFRAVIPKDRSFSTAIRSHFLSPHTWRFHFYDWEAPHFNSNDIDNPEFLQHDFFVTIEITDNYPYSYELKSENRLENLKLWNSYLKQRLDTNTIKIHAMKTFPDLHAKAIVYENLLRGPSPSVIPPTLPEFLPPMKL